MLRFNRRNTQRNVTPPKKGSGITEAYRHHQLCSTQETTEDQRQPSLMSKCGTLPVENLLPREETKITSSCKSVLASNLQLEY